MKNDITVNDLYWIYELWSYRAIFHNRHIAK